MQSGWWLMHVNVADDFESQSEKEMAVFLIKSDIEWQRVLGEEEFVLYYYMQRVIITGRIFALVGNMLDLVWSC